MFIQKTKKSGIVISYSGRHSNLGNVCLPTDAIKCNDANCKDEKHRQEIRALYEDIVFVVYESSKHVFKYLSTAQNISSVWNKFVCEHHTEARAASCHCSF